ncbi:MAG: hypothetical protein IT352_11890, partial [Gemmatimonadales bacterium]|nr:hypothetical protein [Gemmatimonadales bacterium]
MTRMATTLILVGLCGCGPAPTPSNVPLYQNLGTFSVPISTSVEAAQRYFDQGMRLVYAFNHAEAIRAFD